MYRLGGSTFGFKLPIELSKELKAMNEGKEGARYRYPVHQASSDNLFIPIALQVEGFTRALTEHVDGLKAPDYTMVEG